MKKKETIKMKRENIWCPHLLCNYIVAGEC